MPSQEDAYQTLADVRVNSAAVVAPKGRTSPQKEPEFDDEQRQYDCDNADDSQEPRNEARTMSIEELNIHSHSENKTTEL